MTAAPPVGGLAAPLQVLLAGAIDYAGLFPPARLPMASAVANYLSYRESADRWALGRFVVPASRLAELAEVLNAAAPRGWPVPLSVILDGQVPEGIRQVEVFAREAGATVEAVEAPARSDREVASVSSDIPDGLIRYLEVPAGEDADPLLRRVALARGFAKVRTGGTTADAFPAPAALLAFLAAVARHRVPFKATAGLHHPLRGSFRLTYDADAPRAPMYGYLNLVLAAAILWRQGAAGMAAAEAALIETAPGALHVAPDLIGWRLERFDAGFLGAFRKQFFHGFGSCSFREPLDELALLTGPR